MIILADVMEELALSVGSLDIRGFDYPPDKVSPPVFFVALPEFIDPHGAYSEGMQMLTLPAYLVTGRIDDRSSHKRLVSYMDGSLVTAIEGYEYTSCDDVTIARIEFDTLIFSKIDYIGAELTVMVGGSGAG